MCIRDSSSATAVSWTSPPALIVCGGRDQHNTPMTVVEIYCSRTTQWNNASPLPVPRCRMSQTVFHNSLFLIGGHEESTLGDYRKTVFFASIPRLIESCLQQASILSPDLWQSLPDVPHYRCSAASLSGCLLAVGGQGDALIGGPVYSSVHAYCPSSSSWLHVGDLPQPRSRCTTVTLPTGELLVIGGLSSHFNRTNTTYKCSISLD